ncbi:hypothetical protein AOLI_G00012070 [Acnodon oligacanthus]
MIFGPVLLNCWTRFPSVKDCQEEEKERGQGQRVEEKLWSERLSYIYSTCVVCGLVAGPGKSRHHCVERVECEW